GWAGIQPRSSRNGSIVRRSREAEVLLQGVEATRLVVGCQGGADIAQMPRFAHVSGDVLVAEVVADDEPDTVRVVVDPAALRRAAEPIDTSTSVAAGDDVDGHPRLVLAESWPSSVDLSLSYAVATDSTVEQLLLVRV